MCESTLNTSELICSLTGRIQVIIFDHLTAVVSDIVDDLGFVLGRGFLLELDDDWDAS